VWEPKTGKFYVSIPEFDGDGSGAFFKGGIAQINTSGVLEGLYQINYCQPAGLTVESKWGPARWLQLSL